MYSLLDVPRYVLSPIRALLCLLLLLRPTVACRLSSSIPILFSSIATSESPPAMFLSLMTEDNLLSDVLQMTSKLELIVSERQCNTMSHPFIITHYCLKLAMNIIH